MFRISRPSKRASLAALLVVFSTCASFDDALAAQDKRVSDVQPADEARGDAATLLANARTILVRSRTVLVKSEVIESALQKRSDFQQSGILITRDPSAADLTMEVRRSNFTTEYPYVVIDSKTKLVVASGKVNSLFGTAAGKIASGFMKQVQRARSRAGVQTKK